MRIFKNAWFSRFARQEELDDQRLPEAITRADKGLIDADLGGGVITGPFGYADRAID